ncbi:hypothetical protein [Parabacteroides sp. PF5-9]|uniref:hypothetical protein n=1 Tax=Parabacteroides sp. PF5-9 TaxID=1742404 RepID=UPI002474562F|nr:hypothetical protein [Parabacteroides sp. PF5-9]MDH6356539.1 hypothetical protein [Parabacteroides sp. PF5-9]
MADLEKKVKIVNLVGKVKNGRKTEPINITRDLYNHFLTNLPQYLLDVHKYTNADKEEKVQLRIKTKEDTGEIESLYKGSEVNQCICGVVEKGITGKRKFILDSNENKLVGEVKPSEAVLSPVFFILFFSSKLNSLFMITENDASENIFSDITSAIRSCLIAHLGTDKITMKSEIVLGHEKLVDYIKEGEYSQIKIKRKNVPADIADRIYNIKIEEDEECTIEVKISTKKKKIAGLLVEKIKAIGTDGYSSFKTMEELEPLGLSEDSEIVIDSTLNGNKRPISISKLKTPNISQIITVLKTDEGYADFISMENECVSLFKDIVDYV